MSQISPNEWEGNAELREALKNAATTEEMQQIARDFYVRASGGSIQRDPYSPDTLIGNMPAQAKVTKTVTVDQKTFSVDGANEQDATQKLNELLQSLLSGTPPVTATSGAVEEKHGDATTTEDQRYANDWAEATKVFLNSPEGADWPGGEDNKNRLGQILFENNLMDADDKVQALKDAYAHAKLYRVLGPNEEAKRKQNEDLAKNLSGASTYEEILSASRASQGRTNPNSRDLQY